MCMEPNVIFIEVAFTKKKKKHLLSNNISEQLGHLKSKEN